MNWTICVICGLESVADQVIVFGSCIACWQMSVVRALCPVAETAPEGAALHETHGLLLTRRRWGDVSFRVDQPKSTAAPSPNDSAMSAKFIDAAW